MDVVINLVFLVIGGAIGFFASKYFSASSIENKKLASQASESEAALAQYKLDVAEHLDSSASLLAQMNETCQKAMAQMEQSTQLLQQATPQHIDAMPFFSKETQEQLAQTAKLRHQRHEKSRRDSATEAPLDYSGQASGLFSDNTHTVTKTTADD